MAEIKINAGQWDELSEDEKKEIHTILKESELIQEEDQIVGDPNIPVFDPTAPIQLFTTSIQPMAAGSVNVNACEQRCDDAAAVARAACAGIPNWGWRIGCLAAIEAARWVCKSRCN